MMMVTRLKETTDFFFSSRRRHTRSKRDWSSDVCSSDLCGSLVLVLRPADDSADASSCWPGSGLRPSRSEERRVGKESRSRRSQYDYKKKKANEGGSEVNKEETAKNIETNT